MIKLLYKIIHYEPSPDHKDNVMRSFHFILALTSILPILLLYIVYMKIPITHIAKDFVFCGIGIAILGSTYYLIVVRQAKVFTETTIGRQYYDFGKFNTLLKTLAFLLLVGLVILIGRLMLFLLTLQLPSIINNFLQ